MKKIYNLVKIWYEQKIIDDQSWKEFCELVLKEIMR